MVFIVKILPYWNLCDERPKGVHLIIERRLWGVFSIYIGSTHDEIERERLHKSDCNNENGGQYNYKVYKFIRENGRWDNWIFEVIQEFPCENKIELVIREQYHYDLLKPALNTYRPHIPEEELKEYHIKNMMRNIIKII